MSFDDLSFLIFLPAFLLPYLLCWRSWRAQNLVLLIASAIFYGAWDWRFLGLMFGTSAVDYVAGRLLGSLRDEAQRRRVLAVSLVINLGTLFAFKYYGFFAGSLVACLRPAGVDVHVSSLALILPVGISFYTFQSISYAVDCYRRVIVPERNLVSYFTFVCCFPHLVAGPIQRASHLLAQLNRPRTITRAQLREALWLLSWGYFLKQVVANTAASFAKLAFVEDAHSGWTTVLGVLAFGLQIYGDFQAYSLIARGVGRLIGLEFTWNFARPYFATSIQEFWRRWHISLSTWLRDYLYVPLGGNRGSRLATHRNVFLTMLLGGLWHGAQWNFVLWGALHGAMLSAHRGLTEARRGWEVPAPVGWIATMLVVFVGWFLFRCSSYTMANAMLGSLHELAWTAQHARILGRLIAVSAPLVAVELWQARTGDPNAPLSLRPLAFGALTATLILLCFGAFDRTRYEFIYFQF